MHYLHIKKMHSYITGPDIASVVADFEAYRDENGYGARDIGSTFQVVECSDGQPWKHKPCATVSYNGRVVIHL